MVGGYVQPYNVQVSIVKLVEINCNCNRKYLNEGSECKCSCCDFSRV